MRLLLQRVTRAEVRVAGRSIGRIEAGLVVLVGVGATDSIDIARAMARRTVGLRIFADDEGRTNRSLIETGGGALVVSQFTLYAETHRGRRPSFVRAAQPELAIPVYEAYAEAIEAAGVVVARGQFGAAMEVELVNDGPMTIWLDSDDRASGSKDQPPLSEPEGRR